MKMFGLILFGLCVLGGSTKSQDGFAAKLEALRADYGLPSISVVALRGADVVASATVGVRQIGKPDQVTPQDAYQLGSVTKGITATMLARLVERGLLKWESTLGEVFNDIPMQVAYRNVTLLELLTHRAGLPTDLEDETRLAYARSALATPRGTARFEYSNVGYVLASMLAERATGQTWEDLVRQEVLQPLGMQGCGFGIASATDPKPHGWENGVAFALPEDYANPRVMDGADQVRCPLNAVAHYLSAHLRGERGEESAYLAPTTWKRLHQDAFGDSYGFGWVVIATPNNGLAYLHDGSNTANYAQVLLLPSRNLAFAAATNIGADETGNLEKSAGLVQEALLLAFGQATK